MNNNNNKKKHNAIDIFCQHNKPNLNNTSHLTLWCFRGITGVTPLCKNMARLIWAPSVGGEP